MLVKDLQLYDKLFFFKYVRISPSVFEELLMWIAPYIEKQQKKLRDPISRRFHVALRYLVIGDAQVTLTANFCMSPTIVGRIISETCKAIWNELIDKSYLNHS